MTNINDGEEVTKNGTEETTDTTNSETEEELEEVEDSDEDEVEFDDDSDAEDESEKQTQSKEENHKYAELRRKQERKTAESKLVEDSYKKGLVEGIGGVNPYTNEKIVDDDDIEIYKNMREIEKRGGDPEMDYAKYMKIFKQEAKEAEAKKNAESVKRQESAKADIDAFKKAYPDIDVAKLLNDEEFKDYAAEKLEVGMPLSQVYEKFIKFTSKYDKDADTKARRMAAKKISSAGSLSGKGETKSKSFKDMTSAEFRKWQEDHGF